MAGTETRATTQRKRHDVKSFKELGLSEQIQTAIDELGFEEPTPIQDQAIPELLDGHDVIGQAQTGTGKTAAFGLPLLQYLDPESAELQAIVMTPTRELCIQVTQALRSYAEHLDVEVVAVFGGQPIAQQAPRLRAGAQVVVATVGRMMDLISRRILVLTAVRRSEEHTSELQSPCNLVCRLLLEKKKKNEISKIYCNTITKTKESGKDEKLRQMNNSTRELSNNE